MLVDILPSKKKKTISEKIPFLLLSLIFLKNSFLYSLNKKWRHVSFISAWNLLAKELAKP